MATNTTAIPVSGEASGVSQGIVLVGRLLFSAIFLMSAPGLCRFVWMRG